jgi:hypothetical protein
MASKKVKSNPSESIQRGQLESEIRETAYTLYNERHARNIEGDEQSDWLTAENIVHSKYNQQ